MPDPNFYDVLGVSMTASDDEIKEAYDNKLRQISDAYDVLKRKVTRRVYDAGLRHGTSSSRTATSTPRDRPPILATTEDFMAEVGPPKLASSDPSEYNNRLVQGLRFDNLTLNTNPNSSPSSPDPKKSISPFVFGSPRAGAASTSPTASSGPKANPENLSGSFIAGVSPQTYHDIGFLQFTLHDIYNNARRQIKFKRYTCISDREETVEIKAHSTWKNGMLVSQRTAPGAIPTSQAHGLAFYIEEKPYSHFIRAGDDLVCTLLVDPSDTVRTRPLRALSGQTISLDLPGFLIHGESIMASVIPGEGMPKWQGSKEVGKGDLIVKWIYSK